MAIMFALAVVGCSGTTVPPATTQVQPTMPVADASAVTVNFDALKPYFDATPTNFPGVLISREGQVSYIEGNEEVSLPLDPDARVHGVYGGKALLSDEKGSYWFDWSMRRLEPIPELPPLMAAAFRGDTILVSAMNPWQAYLWRPGVQLTALNKPEDLYYVVGVSISPDERYAVVVYDRDVVDGPRVCEIWVYDIETGEITTWPPNAGKVAGSYYIGLLGWADDHTVRYMSGRQGYFGCLSWTIPNNQPESLNLPIWVAGGPVVIADGELILYGSAPERWVIQPMETGSTPTTVIESLRGGISCHVMLNGNMAVSVYSGDPSWLELMADGTVRSWGKASWLY